MRVLERFGSPQKVVEAFEGFYSLDEEWISHFLAYEMLRQSEESVLAGGLL